MNENGGAPFVEIGGRVWELKFSHKVIRQFCRMARCPLSGLEQAMDSYDNEILLLYCMMQRQEPTLTPAQLDDMLDEMPLEDVMNAIAAAVMSGMPKASAEAARREPGDGESGGGAPLPAAAATTTSS